MHALRSPVRRARPALGPHRRSGAGRGRAGSGRLLHLRVPGAVSTRICTEVVGGSAWPNDTSLAKRLLPKRLPKTKLIMGPSLKSVSKNGIKILVQTPAF